MDIVFPDEMKIRDEYTCKKRRISSLELMEDAGKEVYRCLLEIHPLDSKVDKVAVVSGPGNNGGDSLVVARLLMEDEYRVEVVLVGDKHGLTTETQANLNRLTEMDASIYYFENSKTKERYDEIIEESTVIIDGIFGIGLNREVEGIYYKAIEKINQRKAYVFSIDIPSGVRGDNGNIAGIAIEAEFTSIIQNLKVGNLLNSAKDTHGKIKILDIGILEGEESSNKTLIIPSEYTLEKRKNDSHKYNYGSVLIVGGSTGMTGAPLLSAFSSLRTGSGLATIAIHEKYKNQLHNIYPEIMVRPYEREADFASIATKKNAIAFGPGIGRNDSCNWILGALLEMEAPLIIDADGLFHLKPFLKQHKDYSRVVITPHMGEMAMLLGTTSQNIKEKPVEHAQKISEKYGMSVILKGPCTLISYQEQICFSPYGNPGMATAGSGDVLTGIVTSLLGQGYSPLDASKLGVMIHSFAGDICAEEMGEYSMIGTDIIKHIPNGMQKFSYIPMLRGS